MPVLNLSDSQTLALGSSAVKAAYLGSELKHFNPKAISGLEGWWDASDLSTMAQNSDGTTAVSSASDPVGYWADKSGNGRHAKQTINNNRPQIQLADKNGRPGLNFDGANDWYVCDTGDDYAATIAIAVARRTASVPQWGGLYVHRSDSVSAGFTLSAQQFYVAKTSTLDSQYIFGIASAGGVFRKNGEDVTGVNSGVFNLYHAALMPNITDTNIIVVQGNQTTTVGQQHATIGVDPAGAARVYPMRLYELMVFSVIPSASALASIEGYLSSKWGIDLA